MTSVLAVAPALPLHSAGKYVAGAYIVFLASGLETATTLMTAIGAG